MNRILNILRRIWHAVPVAWRASGIGRLLLACYHLPDKDWHALKIQCTLLARIARLRLLAAGLPMKRQFLIVRGLGGADSAGLFSELVTVLGALDHFEHWGAQYAGLQVDFADRGLYYEPAHGANWWQYYFEAINVGSRVNAIPRLAAHLRDHEDFAPEIERLSRARGFALIERYVRPNPHIREKVDVYARANFGDAYVIGVHYRGTDKFMEAPRVAYEQVHAAVLEAINEARPARHKLFIATDEAAFLDYMLELFPGRLLYREMFRSVDGRPIDVVNDDGNRTKGEDAIIDCLLLSRCDYLLRTASSLSLCASFFNPVMPVMLLNNDR